MKCAQHKRGPNRLAIVGDHDLVKRRKIKKERIVVAGKKGRGENGNDIYTE